ncbi:hypothetical protein [Heyndrickxia acidiproducens]|jgi:hypothetical protein|nr:hypothetical protein [Heyndrickxia acidiproducens]
MKTALRNGLELSGIVKARMKDGPAAGACKKRLLVSISGEAV